MTAHNAPQMNSKTQEDGLMKIRGITTGYWIATSLFALQMGFTAYAQLRLPQVAEAFTQLGFPAYFRVELAVILVLLLPAPARLKEWAHAGFAITLVSALIAGQLLRQQELDSMVEQR